MIYNSLTDTLNVFGAPSLIGDTYQNAVILYIQEVGSTQSSQTVQLIKSWTIAADVYSNYISSIYVDSTLTNIYAMITPYDYYPTLIQVKTTDSKSSYV